MTNKKSIKVLLVEDEYNSRKLIVDYLSAYGFEVEAVDDGLSAIERINEHRYDIMILDLRLPGQNGFVVAEQIRRTKNGAELPIVVTSAFTDQANKLKAYQAGANFFLSKPIDLRELKMIVQNTVIKIIQE
jgi:DNA-binding response OmpR family regulator